MVRLCNVHKDNYVHIYKLMDTETQKYLGGCRVYQERYKGADSLVICNVGIDYEFRQKGHATTMLKCIIDEYKNDKRPLLLYVSKKNDIAIHLYKKLGFEIIGEYSNWEWTVQYKPKSKEKEESK